MQHFKLVNWRIRGFVFWCHEQVNCITILGFLRSGLLDHIVNFNAFGKQQQIKLKVNRKLLSKTAQMFLTNGVDEKTQLSLPADTDCHYLHNSEEMSAALSNCGKGKNSAYYFTGILQFSKKGKQKTLMIKLQLFLKLKFKVIHNVWCIKNRTKLSSVLLLWLVRFLMHQTLLKVKSLLIFRIFIFVDEFLVFKSGITFHNFQMLMSYQIILLFFLSQQTILVFLMNKHVRLLILGKKIHTF